MGRHVIRPLVLMPVAAVATIGHDALKKGFQVGMDIRGGVLLNY